METKRTVMILGTPYSVEERTQEEDARLTDCATAILTGQANALWYAASSTMTSQTLMTWQNTSARSSGMKSFMRFFAKAASAPALTMRRIGRPTKKWLTGLRGKGRKSMGHGKPPEHYENRASCTIEARLSSVFCNKHNVFSAPKAGCESQL